MTIIAMSSCSKKINNEFFSEKTFKSYALSSDFPAPDVKTTSLMSDANLYVSLSDDEYESYAESVYEYLSDNDYYYVGTYKQQGLIAEMMPRYVYEALDSNYDFSSGKHNFTYSPTNDLSSRSDGYCKINTCFVITIERVEDTKYSAFASETYNTIIRLGGNNSIFANVKLCESLKWGSCITDETLDYVDIQQWTIGVDPEHEYGKTARIYNEDYAISSWFNTACIREQKYDIYGGSGYVITFTLKDSSIYVLSVSNNFISIREKTYYIIDGIPSFLITKFV